MATASPQHQRQASKPNRQRPRASTASICPCDRQKPGARAGPFLSCRLRNRQASRQERACFVPMKVSLSVLASASLSGATTKPNQSECRRPRTLADLAPTESLRTPPGARWPHSRRAGNVRHPLPWLASLYPAMLVIKVVCRWPLPPFSQRHLHLDNCASRMVARPKRKRMKRTSKIELVNLRCAFGKSA